MFAVANISHAKHFTDTEELHSAVRENPASVEEATFEFDRITVSDIEITSQRGGQRIAIVNLRTAYSNKYNFIHCYMPVKDAADLKTFSYAKEKNSEYKVQGKILEVTTSKKYNSVWGTYQDWQDVHASCTIELVAPKVEKAP